jgi:ubiquinone/menaquinone biosynthesis C-methylase UbiE
MEIKYDKIGINYNFTRRADKYLTGRLFYHLQPNMNGVYLDIGCGTGNYTNEFQKKGFKFIGIDPSEEMLKKAKEKYPKIDWRTGMSENTGLKNESIDGIIAVLTIHHWTNLYQGFNDLHRILKRGGKIVIFTSSPEQMKGYWLNYYFPKMLKDSINEMPSKEDAIKIMNKTGLEIMAKEPYSIKSDLNDLFLYSGKHKPELYLKPEVRNGISSFSQFSNSEEINDGLDKLQMDIQNNTICSIMKSYENDLGDYLFIVGVKN